MRAVLVLFAVAVVVLAGPALCARDNDDENAHTFASDYNTWFLAQTNLQRESHAMVGMSDGWVAMFGGISDSGVLDDLWVRESASGSWSHVRTMLVPPARGLAAAAGLGNGTAFMFGGFGNDGGLLSDLWKLSHTGDTWEWASVAHERPRSSPGNGTAHRGNAYGLGLKGEAAAGGGRVVGGGVGGIVLWPLARMRHDLASLKDEHGNAYALVMFGGVLGDATQTDETWVFHLTNSTWVPVPSPGRRNVPFPSARDGHQLATIDAHRVVLFGGRHTDASGLSSYLNDTWVFDASKLQWTELHPATAPSPRSFHVVTTLSSSTVLLFGGFTNRRFARDTWLFDVASGAWSSLHFPAVIGTQVVPSGVWRSAMATAGEGLVLLFGGFDGTSFVDQTWVFSERTLAWTNLRSAPLPEGRSLHAMASGAHLTSSVAVLFGGADNDQVFNDTWLFQLQPGQQYETSQWQRLTGDNGQSIAGPTNRTGHAMAPLMRNTVVLFGGVEFPSLEQLDDTWLFNTTARAWQLVHTSGMRRPEARDSHALAYMPEGQVVLFGGYGSCGVLGDTWVLSADGMQWDHKHTLQYPPPRWAHAMAACDDVVVLFGGRLAVDLPSEDTWVLYGQGDGRMQWEQVVPTGTNGSPGPRSGHAMASVCSTRLALFGGVGGSGYLDDLWVLQRSSSVPGEGWEWVKFPTSLQTPASRSMAVMTSLWDSSVVVHGGMIYNQAYDFEDGWVMHLGCPSGFYLKGGDFENSDCVQCEIGTYSPTANRDSECTPCPRNFTTLGLGSTSSAQCNQCNPAVCNDQGCGLRDGHVVCVCDRGFYGPLCSDECPGGAGLPCNGGKCNQGVHGDGTCTCGAMYGPAWMSNNCNVPAVGLVIGAVSLVVVASGLFVAWRRYRRLVNADMDHYEQLLKVSEREIAAKSHQVSDLQRSWKLRAKDLEFIDLLGSGSYAEVWRGRWTLLQQEVAIKKMFPLPTHGPEGPPMFDDAEVDCLLRVRGHPRLVLFFGVGHIKERGANALFVVTELMAGGSLQSILSRAHHGQCDFTWAQRLQCAHDIAEGMAYLHSLGFLHRDLKSPNVLSDGKGRFKLADFGLARQWRNAQERESQGGGRGGSDAVEVGVMGPPRQRSKASRSSGGQSAASRGEEGKEDNKGEGEGEGEGEGIRLAAPDCEKDGGAKTLTSHLGSLEWMAPEIIAEEAATGRYNHKVDVYAFGVVLWELLECTGESPFGQLMRPKDVRHAVLSGQRPLLDTEKVAAAPRGFVELLVTCWHQNPSMRPQFPEVLRRLDGITKHFIAERQLYR